jgi:uncharacterized protein GlcG (DUF336 family)
MANRAAAAAAAAAAEKGWVVRVTVMEEPGNRTESDGRSY